MSNLSNRSFCFFCQREFREGEGRYRLIQQEEIVDCCPACFDQARGPSRKPVKERDAERPAFQTEKEF